MKKISGNNINKMEAEKQEIMERLQSILDYILQKDFPAINNVYFEKLVTNLSNIDNSYILQNSIILDWLNLCVIRMEDDYKNVNAKVISFMLKVFNLMISNECIIIEIRERKIADRLLNIIDVHMEHFTPSIKLGYVRVLVSISASSLDLDYIQLNKACRFLIKLCNRDHTLYVVREAQQLVYKLLYKYSVKAKNEKLILEMLDAIHQSLHENVYKVETNSIMINVDDDKIQFKVASTLDLLSYIFEQTLQAEEKINISHLCQIHHELELMLWKLVEMTQNEFFLVKILQALTSLNFALLVYNEWENDPIAPEKFNNFALKFFNSIQFCISRYKLLNFIKLAKSNHVLWKKLGSRVPSKIKFENDYMSFENQLITFQLLPVLFILRHNFFGDVFDNYITKLFEVNCEYTLRICSSLRDFVFTSGTKMLTVIADLVCEGIHGILSMEHLLEREQAILIFQTIIYALKTFVESSKTSNIEKSSNLEKSSNYTELWQSTEFIVAIPNVLYTILIGLQSLMQQHRITWRESNENISLINVVASILENSNITEKLTVQALKLAQLSIEYFLYPNMAVLRDSLNDSGLRCFGSIIVKRLHDRSWEVRDSTLELLTSITDISRCSKNCFLFSKFFSTISKLLFVNPPGVIEFLAFQSFINEYKMCPIVMDVAKNDCELYVRASAFKCLSKMLMIDIIWEKYLNKNNFIEHLIHVLYDESEGLVRKEAIRTLSTIYEYRNIPNKYLNTLYSTLAHCIVIDLYWEVKVEALSFWELEIKKQFTNQGMIYDTLPTFSRNEMKNVTLTTREINLRIIKIFDELSQKGCLELLLISLKEDCDLEVLKEAVAIVQRLFQHIYKYNYESILNEMHETNRIVQNQEEMPNSKNIIDYSTCLMSKEENTTCDDTIDATDKHIDEVIDSILSSQDINLLASSYTKRLHMNTKSDYNLSTTINEQFYKQFTNIGPKEFIDTIKQLDLSHIIKDRQDCLLCTDSFILLLDDILVSIKGEKDPNLVSDCY